jgi:hypothetical protein
MVVTRPYFVLAVFNPASVQVTDGTKFKYNGYFEYNCVDKLIVNINPYNSHIMIHVINKTEPNMTHDIRLNSTVHFYNTNTYPDKQLGIKSENYEVGCIVTGGPQSEIHKADNKIITKTQNVKCDNCMYGYKKNNIYGCDNKHVQTCTGQACQYYQPIQVDYCQYCGEHIHKGMTEHQYWVGDAMFPYAVCSPECQQEMLTKISLWRR